MKLDFQVARTGVYVALTAVADTLFVSYLISKFLLQLNIDRFTDCTSSGVHISPHPPVLSALTVL